MPEADAAANADAHANADAAGDARAAAEADTAADAGAAADAQPDCLFCRIVAGQLPARRVHEDDLVIAFHDVAPRSPTHILVIPRRHIASAADLTEADDPLLGRMYAVANAVARREGIAEQGYRLVSNVGPWGGQTVFHLHLHLMGGRPFTWPPG